MGMRKEVKITGLLIVAMALAVLVMFGFGHSQAGTSQAGGVTDGAMAVDCNASEAGVQTDCQYNPGSTFKVQIHATQAPSVGYFAFQTKLAWDSAVLNYNSADSAVDEGLWPDCGIVASTDNQLGDPPEASVLFACVPNPGSTPDMSFTGAIAEFELQCKADPNALSPPGDLSSDQSQLTLIPRDGDSQLGTHYLDENVDFVDAELAGATVKCAQLPFEPFLGSDDDNDEVAPGGSLVLTGNFGDSNLDCTWTIVSQPEGSNATLADEQTTTDADGKVTATLNGGDLVGTVQVQVECGDESVVLDVIVTPADTGGPGISGPIDNGGIGAGLWAIIASLLAATVVATTTIGWRVARTR